MKHRIVLDTNVLLISIPGKSPYRSIFDAIIKGEIEVVVTSEILNEYFEIISQKANEIVANNVVEMLLSNSAVFKVNTFFKWQLMTNDPDDDKFVDCAIAGNASAIVTNDRHFEILKDVSFPHVSVMNADTFLSLLQV